MTLDIFDPVFRCLKIDWKVIATFFVYNNVNLQ